MNDRSMNKEIIRLLEQEKARLLGGETSGKGKSQIESKQTNGHQCSNCGRSEGTSAIQ